MVGLENALGLRIDTTWYIANWMLIYLRNIIQVSISYLHFFAITMLLSIFTFEESRVESKTWEGIIFYIF